MRFETTGFESSTRAFHFPLYFYYTVSLLPFPLYLFSIPPRSLPPLFTDALRCHLFRRFCPPPRGTINFLDLNPGLCATTITTMTTTTTTTIDRLHFYGVYVYIYMYRTLSVEMRLVPASCALVYRSDDIFTRVWTPRSNLDIRFNSPHHSQRVPRTSIYLASPPRGKSYQTFSPLRPLSCSSARARASSFFLFPYLSRRFICVPYADVASE